MFGGGRECREGICFETEYSMGFFFFLSLITLFLLLCLWIWAFSVHSFSNLFSSSNLNTLDLYMKYTAEMVPLHMYIVWFILLYKCNLMFKNCKLPIYSPTPLMMNWKASGQWAFIYYSKWFSFFFIMLRYKR